MLPCRCSFLFFIENDFRRTGHVLGLQIIRRERETMRKPSRLATLHPIYLHLFPMWTCEPEQGDQSLFCRCLLLSDFLSFHFLLIQSADEWCIGRYLIENWVSISDCPTMINPRLLMLLEGTIWQIFSLKCRQWSKICSLGIRWEQFF